MPGMMESILNLGLNDETVEGLADASGNERFAYDAYRRLLQMFGDVVEGVEAQLFEDALTEAKRDRGVKARRRPRRRRPEEARRRVPADLPRARRRRRSRRTRASSCALAIDAVFRSWDAPRAKVYRRANEHRRRPRHRREHLPDGVRQPGRRLRHRRLLLARPGDRREGAVRRVPAQRPGRGRRRRHPHPRADRPDAGGDARGLRPARRDREPARGALQGRPGHRVHRRARHALPAADPLGQAHRGGRGEDRPRPRGRGRDRRGRGACAGSTRASSTSSCTRASTPSARATTCWPRA